MIALAAFAGGIVAWATGHALGVPELVLLAKPVPVLALAAWTRRSQHPWLTAGLLASALGDLVMEQGREPRFFLGGMAAFALAHGAYVAAFLARSRSLRLPALVPFLAWGALLMLRLWPGLGALWVPVSLYAGLLIVMMWRALAASLAAARWDAAAGAVLFGLSDSLIALDRFDAPIRDGRWLVMATYWAGQYLIARSVRPAG